ncbi:MAG: penicillin-binding protein 2 [Bacteroidetes bacterium]|nr:penicillin-binding protein 2 [Bacteroidota bacterium]
MFDYRIRRQAFIGIIVLIVGVLIMRLAWLQLIEWQAFSGESRSNSLRENRVLPARGVIYDRNGLLLVDNQPTYTVTLTPRYFRRERIPLLAGLLGVSDSLVTAKLREAQQWNSFRPSPSFNDITLDVISRIEENRYLLPGVDYQISQRRRYLTGISAGHALGYVREITRDELNRLRSEGYRPGDLIGKAGLERTYERELRGQFGSEFKLVNKLGREFKPFRETREDVDPVSGYDLHLTLDNRIQALAESLFVNKRGAAIAIDPKSGGIIAMVSQPDVDPRIFSRTVSQKEWVRVTTADGDPLFNRATQSGNPPGSTWKPFMALMGLQTGVITPETVYYCRGRYTLGSHAFRDFGEIAHGPITVERAIQESCNSFFFNLMMQLNLDQFDEYAHDFGFGETMQMDIGEQERGLIPDSAYYDRTYPRGWTAGFTINLGIGQGDMLVTPMQLARYVAAVANEGTLYTPHLVESIRHPETGEELPVKFPPPTTIPIDKKNFKTVKNGMRRVMEHGSGRWAQIPGIPSGGKTGTAQAPGGQKDHSLFILFAPFDDPQIAIAVLVNNGGFGATQAAPIASLMAEKYLTGDIGPVGKWRIKQLMTLQSEKLESTQEED